VDTVVSKKQLVTDASTVSMEAKIVHSYKHYTISHPRTLQPGVGTDWKIIT
jgi:hypothetical protein